MDDELDAARAAVGVLAARAHDEHAEAARLLTDLPAEHAVLGFASLAEVVVGLYARETGRWPCEVLEEVGLTFGRAGRDAREPPH